MKPFYSDTIMRGESVLFIREKEGQDPAISLLFVPDSMPEVRSPSLKIQYEPGKDFNWKPGLATITVPAGSKIPVKAWKELTPPKGSQPFNLVRRDGTGDILFGAAHEYHDMQCEVTYSHKGSTWNAGVPKSAARDLPITMKKLHAGDPLAIVLLGDSISAGANASKKVNVEPHQPFFGELLQRHLHETHHSEITLTNLAVGGKTSSWGIQQVVAVVKHKPDLVMIGFGMNDCNEGIAPTAYAGNIQQIMAEVKKSQPQTEFIVIATMTANPDWYCVVPDRFVQYRDELAKLVGPGVALADMTSIWIELLKHKKYLDITGNGVNHPNDFGYRIYAQVLAATLSE